MQHSMSLNQSFEEFLEQLQGQSTHNRGNYNLRLRGFLEIHGQKTAAEIKRLDVNKWVAKLEERGYREATLTGYRQAIKTFFNYLVAEEQIHKSPASHAKTGSYIPSNRRLPSETAVEQATDLAWQWLDSDKRSRIRDGLFFLLSKGGGSRLRELRELRKSDVEAALALGPDHYGIYKVRSKGKSKEIIVRFNGAIADGFERWLAVRPPARIDRCFVTVKRSKTDEDPVSRYRALGKSGATEIYRRVCRHAGIERPFLSHALRHRVGDKITKEHGPKVAAMMLNHKDWQTSRTAIAFYHHPDEEDVSRAAAALTQPPEAHEVDEMAKFFRVPGAT